MHSIHDPIGYTPKTDPQYETSQTPQWWLKKDGVFISFSNYKVRATAESELKGRHLLDVDNIPNWKREWPENYEVYSSEEYENEAEVAFFKSHPELNP